MTMETPADNAPNLAETSKRLAQRTLVICENRLELLLVEVEEERERILRVVWLGLGALVFGLLAGVALTAVVAVAFWQQSPVAALLILALLYIVAGCLLCTRLAPVAAGDWQTLPTTFGTIEKGPRMPGKSTQLKSLETRKQLLLIESELNRVQLLKELDEFKIEICHLKQQAGEISSLVSSATKLVSTVSAIGRAFSHEDEGGKGSWMSTLLKGAKIGTSLWLLLRGGRRKA